MHDASHGPFFLPCSPTSPLWLRLYNSNPDPPTSFSIQTAEKDPVFVCFFLCCCGSTTAFVVWVEANAKQEINTQLLSLLHRVKHFFLPVTKRIMTYIRDPSKGQEEKKYQEGQAFHSLGISIVNQILERTIAGSTVGRVLCRGY